MTRSDEKITGAEVLAILVVFLIFMGIVAVGNYAIYGDWTCAFAECRKVV